MKKLNFTTSLLTVSFPLIAGVVMLPAVAAATTFAFSSADARLTDFNWIPTSQDTLATANTTVSAIAGLVTANSDANAVFVSSPPIAENFSVGQVIGSGTEYTGQAQGLARIIGQFFIPETAANQVFKFNFLANLDLESSVDDPGFETAAATGNVMFSVFVGAPQKNLTLVDFFVLTGNVNSASQNDFLDVSSSAYVTFNKPTFSQLFGGQQEFALASVEGSYERTFDAGTYITLVETKTSQASAAAVPEPSTMLAVALSGAAGIVFKRRKSTVKPKINH